MRFSFFCCIFLTKCNHTTKYEEDEDMENGRKIIYTCLLVVVLAAIVLGILYYNTQSQGEITIAEGTLVERI